MLPLPTDHGRQPIGRPSFGYRLHSNGDLAHARYESHSNRPKPDSRIGRHEPATVAHFHSLGRSYPQSRVAAQRLVAVYFPFVQLLSAAADVIVLGVGARLVVGGHLTTGALIAFILDIDLPFSPIQQLSSVFDSWQQTRTSVRRIDDLMALTSLTPAAEHPVRPTRGPAESPAGPDRRVAASAPPRP